ncbi:MAG: hypothetical protein AMXMBFR64_01790 [Myxococcales bacterium]
MTRETWRQRHALPVLGHGIGLRRPFFDTILEVARPVDWLEVVPENFILFGGRPRRALAACAERWPIIPHGVSLSVGGPDPLDTDLLNGIRTLARDARSPWFSDHLCWSAAGGTHTQDLIPLPFSEEAVRHVAPRIREVSERVGLPFLVENISSYAIMPGSTMSEAQFLTAALEEADCGLLLDVNNVVVNAHNHGFDPVRFIQSIPLERVVQIHVAGHRVVGDLRVDDHGSAVSDPVWALYEHVIARIGPTTTLVEWDNHIPPVDVVLDEADKARDRAEAALARRAA